MSCNCPECGAALLTDEAATLAFEDLVTCPSCGSTVRPGDMAASPIVVDPDAGDAGAPEIPGFTRLRHLASGGMGDVYVGYDSRLDRQVAIKVPRAEIFRHPEARERFLNEARAAARLEHPNICPIHDVPETNGLPCIIMGYVEGCTLIDWAQDQARSPRECAEIMAPLCHAVHYAHRHRIIHRDLKPHNVLISAEDGRPVLTDFGLAKSIDEDHVLTKTGAILGTPAYMAPEQAAGDQDRIGPATDVYGLGGILYHLICGQAPFKCASTPQLLVKISFEEPPPPRRLRPGVHRDLETICLKALAKDPRDRYASAEAMAEDLERFCRGDAILARPIDPVTRAWRGVRKRPFTYGGIAAALLLGVAVSFYFRGQSRERQQVIESSAGIEETLQQARWTGARLSEAERRIEAFAALAPDRARHYDQRLTDRLTQLVQAELARPVLVTTDLECIRGLLDLLALPQRNPDRAEQLRLALADRARSWQEVAAVVTPIAAVPEWLAPADFAVTDGQLVAAGQHLYRTMELPSAGNCRLDITFAPGWRRFADFGVVLNRTEDQYLAFDFWPAGHGRPSQALPTLVERDVTYVTIRRQYNFLAAVTLPLPTDDAPLEISARREGARLEVHVNGQLMASYLELFPWPPDQAGNFGLVVPPNMRLSAVRVFSTALPRQPSPLELADRQYEQGQYARALQLYEEQSRREESTDQADLEARYKQALCLYALERKDAAETLLRQVLEARSKTWSAAAGLRLWEQFAEEERNRETGVIIDYLQACGVEDISPILSPGRRNQLRTALMSPGAFHRYRFTPVDPQTVVYARQGCDLLGLDARLRATVMLTYVRTYRSNGEVDKALQLLDELLAGEPVLTLHLSKAQILIANGRAGEARESLDRLLADQSIAGEKDRAVLYLARGQANVALGDPEAALTDTRDYVRISGEGKDQLAPGTTIWLMQGLLLEQLGRNDEAREAWLRGWEMRKILRDCDQQVSGQVLVDLLIMGSQTGELSTDNIGEIVGRLWTRMSTSRLMGMSALLPPAVLEHYGKVYGQPFIDCLADFCRRPEGRETIRHLAFHDVPYNDWLGYIIRSAAALAGETVTWHGHAPQAWRDIYWRYAGRGYEYLREGRIREEHMFSMLVALKGGAGAFGWRAMAPQFPADTRAVLGLVLARRCIQAGQRDQAESILNDVLKAGGDDEQVRKLAEEQLASARERATTPAP